MKKMIMLAACAALAAAAVARADEKPAEKQLTIDEAVNVLAGLRSLVAQYTATDKDGKTSVGYNKFSADTRLLIAVNLDVGLRAERALQAANDQLVASMSNGAGAVPDAVRGTYAVEYRKIMESPCRCSYYRIKKEDLRLDDNPQILGALGLLIPIVDR